MNLDEIHQGTPIYKLDKENLCLIEEEVFYIWLLGITNRVRLSILNVEDPIYFKFNETEEIEDGSDDWFFDRQLAEEELVIARTNDARACYE